MTMFRVVALAVGLLAVAVAPAFAQAAPPAPPAKPAKAKAVGVFGGISLSRISPDASDEVISRGFGAMAGVYLQVPMFSTIGLQLELVYAQKNTHLTSTRNLMLDYVEIPILAKLKLVKKLYLTEGVAVSFPVRARLSSSSAADQDIKDQITTPDIGMVIGGGMPVRKLAIEVRYEGGFKTVFKSPIGFQRSRSFSLLVRVPF